MIWVTSNKVSNSLKTYDEVTICLNTELEEIY